MGVRRLLSKPPHSKLALRPLLAGFGERGLAGNRAIFPELVAVRVASGHIAGARPGDVSRQARPEERRIACIRREAPLALAPALERLHVAVREQRVQAVAV